MARRLRWHLLALLLSAAGGLLWWAGGRLAAPSPATVGAAPEDLPAYNLSIASASGSRLAAWFVPGNAGRGALLLLHGKGGNRRSMLGRARFLHRRGHALLLIDLQASGESPGRHMTSGHLEARDAEAALDWIHGYLPAEPVGIIGFSLGGAAALLGEAARRADALVLEAVYTDIDSAIGNRLALWLGPAGRRLTPLLRMQYRPRMGLDPDLLAPINRIGGIHTPVLIIGGSHDQHTRTADTRRLFAAANPPKRLWIVKDARHQDFHAFDPDRYQQQVGDFLDRYLGVRDPGAGD